jgi:hypothetical protein
MYFNNCFIVAFLFFASVVNAQVFEWARSAGELSRDAGRGICVDKDGNVIVAGYFSGKIKFDETTYEGRGIDDIFIAKYNPAGDLLWARTAGGPLDDIAVSVAADNEGNIFVAGSFDSIAFFDNVLLTSNGGIDGFITKYNTNGDLVWVKKIGGVGVDRGFAVAADYKGAAYITGTFEGFAAFGNSVLTSKGNADVYVAKYSADGDVEWAKRAGGNQEDLGLGIAVDFERGCYITGSFKNLADFGDEAFFTPSVSSEIYIAKIDSAGQWEWAEQAGGLTGDAGYAVAVDDQKNSYITGYFADEAYFGNFTLLARGYNDIFVAKYGAKGLCLWATHEGGTSLDLGTGIAVASDGSIFVSGAIDSIANFSIDTIGTGKRQDIFLAKWDKNGNYQWVREGGGANFQLAMAVAVGNDQDIYVTGYFYALLELGDTTLVQTQDADMFLLKYKDPLLSVAEYKEDVPQLLLYPNPTSSAIVIKSSDLRIENIVLYDVAGKIQSSFTQKEITTESQDNLYRLNISHLAKGTYFCQIKMANGQLVVKRVIKE